jgi:hypothetical protein
MSTPPNQVPASNVPANPAPVNKSGSLIPWLLGLFGTGLVILCLIALVTVRYIFSGSQIRRQGKNVEISTPLGDLKVEHGADPGLPKYPGAREHDESASVELTAPTEDKLRIIAGHYFTSDPLGNVDAWYGRILGSDFEREGPGEKRRISNFPHVYIESSETAYVSDRKDAVRLVILQERSGGVEIKLVHIGPREVQ